MNAAAEGGFASRIFLACAGLMVWAAHFLFVYVFTALACARAFADVRLAGMGIVPLVILAATVAALVLLAWLSARAWRSESRVRANGSRTLRFLRYLGAALGLYSAAAILLQALPALILPVCA